MIDILIPAINSDIPMLSKTIEGARRNVSDGVNEIFIIASETEEMKDACNLNNVNFVNEVDSIGFSKGDFDIGNGNRNGWLYQQLLKLNGDKISTTDNFLVLDADHVLLKPHRFVGDNKFYFYSSKEYHAPYFKAIGRIFGEKYKKIYDESFISDKMILNKHILAEMKGEIEATHNKKWCEEIIDSYERTSFCGFSEFETYGTYISNKYNNMVIIIPDKRLMCFDKRIEKMSNDELEKEFDKYNSITEHKNANLLKKHDRLDIFTCTHKDFEPLVTNGAYKQINCNDINNDTWNGLKGSFYSEIMSYFYIAENYKLKDYVGFCHYRKYFSFMDNIPDMDDLFSKYDAVISKPIEYKTQTIKGQYGRCHNIEDLYIVGGVIADKYPEYSNMWHKFVNGKKLIPYNMFIMKRDDFLKYINFVKDILDEYVNIVGKEIEKRIENNKEKYIKDFYPNNTVEYQYRIGGYLAERLTNVFILKNFNKLIAYPVKITENKYKKENDK